MGKFYVVGFDETGDTYYFHSKENAIKFAEESYQQDFGKDTEDEVYITDITTLKQDGYIDDYTWIEECYFEDEG